MLYRYKLGATTAAPVGPHEVEYDQNNSMGQPWARLLLATGALQWQLSVLWLVSGPYLNSPLVC